MRVGFAAARPDAVIHLAARAGDPTIGIRGLPKA